MNRVQILKIKGRPAFAILNYDDYRDLLSRAKAAQKSENINAEDLAADIAQEKLGKRARKLPRSLVESLQQGEESPLRILRKFRGVSVAQLAAALGVSTAHIYMVEQGMRGLSTTALKKAARLLKVNMDLLI